MATQDVLLNRLEAAKDQAMKFVDLLPVGVDIGVISFSGDAIVLLEPDNNKQKVKMAINSIEFGEVQGTNVYNALISANKILGLTRKKSVLIISDGQLNVADAPQIIKYIKRNNLIVNTVAIGTKEGGVSPFNTISKVDVDFLKALSYNSQGEFFSVEDGEELEESVKDLVNETYKRIEIDLTFYLLILAILIFTVLWVLYNLRLKVVP
jgi:Ca-activated chloride channel family protein